MLAVWLLIAAFVLVFVGWVDRRHRQTKLDRRTRRAEFMQIGAGDDAAPDEHSDKGEPS